MKHLLLTTIAAVVLPIIALSGPIHDAAMKGDLNGVQAELDKGIDVDQLLGTDYVRDPLEPFMPIVLEGAPLHYAVVGGHKEVAELLISKGADVNAKDKDGWTPLHEATMGGHKEVAELLIVKGADVNAKDEGGNTPLDGAEEVSEDGSPEDKAAKKETADLLRKHGGKTGEELKAEGN